MEAFIESAVSKNCALGDPSRSQHLATANKMLANEAVLKEDFLVATISGNQNVVQSHIEQDNALTTRTRAPFNWTPLLYLCFSRFWHNAGSDLESQLIQNAKCLLDSGAKADDHFLLEDSKETCLYGAVGSAGNPALAELLIRHGAQVNDGEVAYHAAEFPGAACAKVLFQNGMSQQHQATVLLRKLDFDDMEGTRELLELGADPDGMGIWGKTPLHQAVMRGRNLETIRLLLSYGADPGINRSDGVTTLQLAVESNRNELIEMLKNA